MVIRKFPLRSRHLGIRLRTVTAIDANEERSGTAWHGDTIRCGSARLGPTTATLADFEDYLHGSWPNILYGKSWKKDLKAMGNKDGMRSPRFNVMHQGEELSLVTRSSDGKMLFLANMASKMNEKSALGSRIAEVHNGSSLFTGDAGQGESNIRRWLIENDWLDAIETLRFTLGDENICGSIVDEFGDDLFTGVAKVSAALEKRLADWGNDEDEGKRSGRSMRGGRG